MCHMKNMLELVEEESYFEVFIRKQKKLLRKLKGKLTSSRIDHLDHKKVTAPCPVIINLDHKDIEIIQGDMVKVRSQDEINSMLDDQGEYNKLPIMPTMYGFCGQTYRVKKEVNYFYDEDKQKVCKCKNIVILEGSNCSGCDLYCYYFWHKAWLEKI